MYRLGHSVFLPSLLKLNSLSDPAQPFLYLLSSGFFGRSDTFFLVPSARLARVQAEPETSIRTMLFAHYMFFGEKQIPKGMVLYCDEGKYEMGYIGIEK